MREGGANECWHYTGINHDLVVNTLGLKDRCLSKSFLSYSKEITVDDI